MLDDRYRIEGQAGAGAFGTVFRGTQLGTHQAVAIKFLHGPPADRAHRRFEREMALCARLHHPNIVRLIDTGTSERGDYVVFEWVPGTTLADLLAQEGALTWRETQHLMSQVLDALACAHRAGIVHRDLKPHNIMVTATGVRRNAVVLDFGIGALLEDGEDGFDRITRSREIVGTPAYAAPEQLRGERATAASDLYAWALTFAECLCGQRIVQGCSMQAIWYEQLRPEPVALPSMFARHPIAPLLRRALKRDVELRASDAGQVLAELDALEVDALPDPSATRSDRQRGTSASRLGEYRQVTTVCVRIVLPAAASGSDLEERAALVQRCRRRCETAARRLDGRIHEVFGDRLALCFGYPVAMEDATARALRCALEIRREDPEHVAIGVHTAMIVLRGSKDDADGTIPLGLATEVAAQLSEEAQAGVVVCSAETQAIVGRTFELDPSEPAASGFFVKEWLGHAVRHRERDLPFEGRGPELMQLRSWLADAADGRGCAVLLSGEPGVGKSRLVAELEASDDRTFTWIRIHGAPQSGPAPSDALGELLLSLTRLSDDATASRRRDALTNLLESSPDPRPEHVAALSDLLGVPIDDPQLVTPDQRRAGARAAILDLLARVAAKQPVALVVDDLQWCESALFELLGELLEEVSTSAMFVVLVARPDLEPPWPSRLLRHLRLERLASSEARRIVEHVARGQLTSRGLIEEIVRRGEGVPLFVEQLTRMVLERLGSVDDVTRSADLLDGIPAGLRDALYARLDRMGDAKDVALAASILAPSFEPALLARVVGSAPSELNAPLQRLVEAQIFERKRQPSGWRYRFRHALLREAAHASVLETTRRKLHARVAEILLAERPELAKERPGVLAHHYANADRLADALPFGLAASEQALARSANVEAIAHALRVRSWLAAAPDEQRREIALATIGVLVPALLATEGYAAAQVPPLVEEARRLAGDDDHSVEAFRALRASCLYHHARAELSTALELGERCLQIATTAGLESERASIQVLLAQCAFVQGRLGDADVMLREALQDVGADVPSAVVHGHDLVSGALALRAIVACFAGRSKEADALAARAIDRAYALGHHNSTAGVLAYVGGLHHYRRDRRAVEDAAQRLLELADRHALPQWRALGGLLLAWCRREIEAPAQMLDALSTMGVRLAWPYWSSTVAESELSNGDAEGAAARLNEAIEAAETSGERYYLCELLRQCAEADAVKGERQERITALLDRAIASAEETGAVLFALRAALAAHRLAAPRHKADRVASVERIRAMLPTDCTEPETRIADELLAG